MWTGRFVAPFPEQEVCVDCIREGEGDAAESKDLSIQQMKHLHKKDKK
jgi:hypothetical protein